jgi:hypothetical protein
MISTLIATLLLGQSPVLEFKNPVVAQPGQFILIKPSSTNGKRVKYAGVSPGISIFPPDQLADKTATVCIANMPGKYILHAATAVGDEPSEIVEIQVFVGSVPNPGPKPPGPIPPVPPDVTDELLEVLRPIWGALNEPLKDQKRDKLVKVYQDIAAVYRDESFITAHQAFLRSVDIRKSSLADGDLAQLRSRIGEELNVVLPRDPSTVLSAEIRKRCADQYDRMAKLIATLGS